MRQPALPHEGPAVFDKQFRYIFITAKLLHYLSYRNTQI